MSTTLYFVLGVLVMAAATYLPRALPMSLMRKKIGNTFFQSFLYYMPFAVLSAMTIPAIFYATSTPWSAAGGMVVAMGLSYLGCNLLPVSLAATAMVFVMEWLIKLFL